MAINSVNYYAAAAKAMSNTSNSVNRSSTQYGSWYKQLYGTGTTATTSNATSSTTSSTATTNGTADATKAMAASQQQMLASMYSTATSGGNITSTQNISSADAALQKLYATVTGVSTGTKTSADNMLAQLSNTVTNAGGGTAYQMAKSLTKSISDQTAALADSAGFVKSYSDSLKSLKQAANALNGSTMKQMLGKTTDGAYAQSGIDKAASAVQTMVDQYNTTRSNLSSNTSRGSGVTRQLSAMSQTPTSARSMAKVGLGYDDKGNMTFDKTTFTNTLQNAAKSDATSGTNAQTNLTLDIMNTVSRGVERSSTAGLMRQTNSLINNDLKNMNDQRVQQVISAQSSIYTQNGLAALAGAGSFLNMQA